MKRKHTPLGKNYWDDKGAYHIEKEELYKKLVPDMGDANTVHGELLRSINRLYYDFCNNGNCNVVDSIMRDCSECGGGGYEEGDDCSFCEGECKVHNYNEMDKYFGKLFEFIKDTLPQAERPLVDNLEKFILAERKEDEDYFVDVNMAIYDKVMDAVMYHILTTENAPREVVEV